nr:MAG TPA: Transcriptional activator RinB [Bacteriophage sp.]
MKKFAHEIFYAAFIIAGWEFGKYLMSLLNF